MTEQSVSGDTTKRTRLLEAALDVFSRRGFHAATMEEIAQEAQIAKGTIYLYFPTKDALFSRLLAHGLALVETAVQQRNRGLRDPLYRLQNMLDELIRLFLSQATLFRLILRQVFAWGERGEEASRRWRKKMTDRIQRDLQRLYPKRTAQSVAIRAQIVFAFLLAILIAYLAGDLDLETEEARVEIEHSFRAILQEGSG
jgi:AcrR family transcriptional regulator